MNNTLDAVLQALRNYFVDNNDMPRAHFVTAAINEDEQARDHIVQTLNSIDPTNPNGDRARGGFSF